MPIPRIKLDRYFKTALLVAVLCGGAEAAIENFGFADTRGASLGGAISATVDDAAAGLINPAALGFMARASNPEIDNNNLGEQKMGWNLVDIGAGASLTGDLGGYLEILGNVDFNNFDPGKLEQPGNVENLLSMAGALGNISDRDTILVDANAGTAVQIGSFAIGVRAFGQVGGWLNDVDVVRLGLGYAVSEIADDLRDALDSEGGLPGGYVPKSLTGDQQQKLKDAFSGLAVDDVVNYIDSKITELVDDGTISRDQINGAIDTLSSIIDGAGGLLSDNQTSIVGRGFGALEVPISYGYAVNDNLSFGVTTKLMFGRVYGTQVWAFNDSNTDIIEDTLDSSNDSFALGLDLAAMYRIPKWQFALVGHNLNKPRFDGYDQEILLNGNPDTIHIPDVVLDPQVTVGAAWYPIKRFMVASDFELLETGTLLNHYNIQRLSFGTELDVGAAISIDDTVVYDGTEYPRTARLYAAVSLDF